MIAFWDIETDGLDATCMWVAVIKPRGGAPIVVTDASEAVDILNQYDAIVGHNIVGFDAPQLEKLTGKRLTAKLVDTLLMSRVLYPDRFAHPAKGNSLKCWGEFLGFPKGDHDDWSCYSEAMRDYCIQDVEVTERIYDYVISKSGSESRHAFAIEHSVAQLVRAQEANGFGFNVDDGERLLSELLVEKTQITQKLQQVFPPIVEERWSEKTGKRLKDKVTVFNPGSRMQIEQRFRDNYGWKPRTLTETGRAKIDESTLGRLKYPEAAVLCRYLMIEKRASQVEQWLKFEQDGIIHGQVNTNGTVSGRMSHSKPNVAQVPAVRAEFGERMRSLFGPTRKGWVQVGADASGLELRMLAHFLAKYDGGEYGKVILEGDVHTHNQHAAGLETRDQAKTFIYATLYGAGATKIGSITGGGASAGQALKDNFERNLPALTKLKNQLSVSVARRSLRGLDGRPLPVRSDHMALNLLLQSAGAVVMKQALIHLDEILSSKVPGQYAYMANVHDEFQLECHPDVANTVGEAAVAAIQMAGETLSIRIQLDGEYKVGQNWSDCH